MEDIPIMFSTKNKPGLIMSNTHILLTVQIFFHKKRIKSFRMFCPFFLAINSYAMRQGPQAYDKERLKQTLHLTSKSPVEFTQKKSVRDCKLHI